MSETMVEIVAQAIWFTENSDSADQWDEFWSWYQAGAHDPKSCAHYSTLGKAVTKARAALKAMREPTEAMREAGHAGDVDLSDDDPTALRVWHRMIDAALEEGGADAEAAHE